MSPDCSFMRTVRQALPSVVGRTQASSVIPVVEIQSDKWTISYPMFLDPEYQFFEYACHEDNTAVRNFIATSQFERGLRGKAR